MSILPFETHRHKVAAHAGAAAVNRGQNLPNGQSFESVLQRTNQGSQPSREPQREPRRDFTRSPLPNSTRGGFSQRAQEGQVDRSESQATILSDESAMDAQFAAENTEEQNLGGLQDEEQTIELEDVEIALEIPEEADYAISDDVMQAIAAVLNITPSQLAELMNALGIGLDTLNLPENKQALLAAVHGVDEAIELVNIADILPTMESIGVILQDYSAAQQNRFTLENLESLEDGAADPNLEAYSDLMQEMEQNIEIASQGNNPSLERRENPTVTTTTEESSLFTANSGSEVEAEAEIVSPTATSTTQQTAAASNNIDEILLDTLPNFNPLLNMPNNMVDAEIVLPNLPQAPVNPQEVMEQIVQSMRLIVSGNFSEMRIQLKPEHLGDMTMKIATINSIVTAQFTVESQRVKEIIEANFNQLRDSLNAQGIEIGNVEVSVSQDQSSGSQTQHESQVSAERIGQVFAQESVEAETQATEPVLDSQVDIRI